jgi:hypothetical protein
MQRLRSHCEWLFVVILCMIISVLGQQASDCALQLSADVQADSPQITLRWPPLDSAIAYAVSRKAQPDLAWGDPVALPPDATSYTDTNVLVGVTYEYQVYRAATNCNSYAYILSGIEVPLVDKRGKLILVVDNTLSPSLAPDLAQLQQDLVGDGWTVIRHDVPRMAVDPANSDPSVSGARANEVAAVKSLIRADYLTDLDNVCAVLLLGHVPVPYSGSINPDEHPDHRGAWPADVYYGDMAGVWTDSIVGSTAETSARNVNLPGDGKFDQSHVPGTVVLEVGRVDLSNLPSLNQSEVNLMRGYLKKNHSYRQALMSVQPSVLIDDMFGVVNGEAFAANSWANLGLLFGPSNVSTGRWLTVLTREDNCVWAYGCGPGTYSGAAGVVDTQHFLVYDVKAVFTSLFGSYFGDWNSQDNLLRAPLAGSRTSLTCAWMGRPDWYLHAMGLGETIGFATRLTQNNAGLYKPSATMNGFFLGQLNPAENMNAVHIALMGDPTLRLHPANPPTGLTAMTNNAGGVDLAWTFSVEGALGYHVYRASALEGPYTCLTAGILNTNVYTDTNVTSQRFYMVRSVHFEGTGSGTYLNMSQGAFAEAALSPASTNLNEWPGRGLGVWKINDVTGTAGDSSSGWDLLTVDGEFDVTATTTNQFTLRVMSIQSDGTPGPAAHFNNTNRYTWPVIIASNGIHGFDPARIDLRTSDFQGDLGGGTFKLELSTNSTTLNLIFTPNRAPVAQVAVFGRDWDKPVQISITDLLASASDLDGDPRALVQIGSSTNGTSIVRSGDTLTLTPTNNISETLTYWIQDVRPYRPGDTIRMAQGTISIVVLPQGLSFNAYHAIEIEWQGQVGHLYQLQSRLETQSDWSNQGEPMLGTGADTSFFERSSNVTKFYRIVPAP